VWNLLTRTVWWSVGLRVASLAVDGVTSRFAVTSPCPTNRRPFSGLDGFLHELFFFFFLFFLFSSHCVSLIVLLQE
jgi:hypothetical protein